MPLLRVGWKSGDLGERQSQVHEAVAGGAQRDHADGHDHRRDRLSRGEPDRPGAERMRLERPLALDLVVRCELVPVGLRRGPRGPEERAAEDRKQRRHERDRDREAHEDGHRHPRAEGSEEVERSGEEGRGARRDDQPGRHYDRRVVGRRALSRDEAMLARVEAVSHAREVEDRVVGHDPEQEDDEHRLHLARYGHVRDGADPADDPDRHEVRNPGGGQDDQRREGRAEAHGDEHGDDPDRREGHPEERRVDLPPRLHPGRRRARHADDRVARVAEVGRDVAVGGPLLIAERRVAREEEVGRGRRQALLRRRHDPGQVRYGNGKHDVLDAFAGSGANGRRTRDRVPLRRRREPIRVTLDDDRMRAEGNVEDAGGPHGGLERLGVLGDEPGQGDVARR